MRRRLRLALQLALTALVTWFILDRVGVSLADLRALDLSRWQPQPLAVLGSAALLLAGYALSALLWAGMVRELGGAQLTPRTALRVYMVSNLGRYVPGKVLQVAGLAWLARREGITAGTAVRAALVSHAFALAGAGVIGLPAFLSVAPDALRAVVWASAGAVGVAALVLSAKGPSRGFGVRWLAGYTLNWGIYALAFWLFFTGLEGAAPVGQVAPAFAAAYLAGYVALFAPAGAGVREAALVVFLVPLVPQEAALALAIASRLWTTGLEVIPAAWLAWRHGPVDPVPDA